MNKTIETTSVMPRKNIEKRSVEVIRPRPGSVTGIMVYFGLKAMQLAINTYENFLAEEYRSVTYQPTRKVINLNRFNNNNQFSSQFYSNEKTRNQKARFGCCHEISIQNE